MRWGLPSLYTIVQCCPTILFSLETNTRYGESEPSSSVSTLHPRGSDRSRHHTLRHLRHPRCASSVHVHRAPKPSVSALSRAAKLRVLDRIPNNLEIPRKHRPVRCCFPVSPFRKLLSRMLVVAQTAQARLEQSKTQYRVAVSYNRPMNELSVENLPILSLILKRVSVDFPTVVYSLERMVCDEKRVVCVLAFNEERNWVKIINGYESSLEVSMEEGEQAMSRVNSQPVFIDL